jgi:hypothetical protein
MNNNKEHIEQDHNRTAYNVHVFYEKGFDKSVSRKSIQWFENFPGPIKVTLGRAIDIKINPDGKLKWDHIFEAMNSARLEARLNYEDFVFLITKTPNELNWFAACDLSNPRNRFGHSGDYSWVTSAPDHAIIAHYIIGAIFSGLITESGIDCDQVWHEGLRGCFFDHCAEKWELGIKLRTADICGDCMEILKYSGATDHLMKQTTDIREGIRTLSINTSQYLDNEAPFSNWPFPVAITRHKIVQSLDATHRFMLMLDHFDSLIRYFYFANEVMNGREPQVIERPSLGWWVNELSNRLDAREGLMEVIRITEKEKVVKLRNDLKGHGWAPHTEKSYADEAKRLESILTSIENLLKPFFESHKLLVPRTIRMDSSGAFIAEADILSGSNILHPREAIRFQGDPRHTGITSPNSIYLANREMSQFKSMSPFFLSTYCPACCHPRILVSDGGESYIDVFMGHRVTISNLGNPEH